MEYIKDNNIIALRLDKGDKIADSIIKVCKKENIISASVSGIGATNDVIVGVFDPINKKYENITSNDDLEIASLNGNITLKDNNPFAHLHIVCQGLNNTVAGHLIEATISLTCEIYIVAINKTIKRELNKEVGINTWSF